MTTNYSTRTIPTTNYTTRRWVKSDLAYLLTQLGRLCTNNWERILFHSWTFYDTPTPFVWRTIPTTNYTTRPII